MPPEAAEWIVDIGASRQDGLLRSFDEEIEQVIQRGIRQSGLRRRFRFVKKSRNPNRPWDDVDVSTATAIEWAIGEPDVEPTGGVSNVSYLGDSTGLAAIPAGVSAAVLEAAMNANPAIAAAGGVTVEKAGVQYTILFNDPGARSLIDWDSTAVSPKSTAEVMRTVVGDVATREEQLVRLSQDYYGYTNVYTAAGAGALSRTEIRAGDSQRPNIQRISISPEPYEGAFSVTFPRPEITRVGAIANAGIVQSVLITPVADVAGSLAGKFFDIADSAGGVRVWYNTGADPAPAAPVGGRLIEVAIVVDDPIEEVMAQTIAAIDGDAQFTAAVYDAATSTLYAKDVAAGVRPYPIFQHDSGFILTYATAGTNGLLAGKGFILYRADNVDVYVWLQVSANDVPAAIVGGWTEEIVVAIAATATATAVATAIAAAVDASPHFVATSSGSSVTITDAVGGEREAAHAGSSPFGVVQSQAGLHLATTVPYNASADLMAALLSDQFQVTKTDAFQWDLTSLVPGTQPALEVASAGLKFSAGGEMAMKLNKLALYQAFAATDADELTTVTEVRITWPGVEPEVVFHVPIKIARNLIKEASVDGYGSSGMLLSLVTGMVNGAGMGVTGLNGGGATKLDGVSTLAAISMVWAVDDAVHGWGIWELVASTQATNIAAGWMRPLDYSAVTNEKVWKRRI